MPRASPARWRSRRAGGTSAAPSSRPTSASGAWPKTSSHGGVDLDDPPAGVDRDHGVERGVEHRPLARLAVVDGGLRAAVLDELAREPPEARERRDQVLVGLAHAAR